MDVRDELIRLYTTYNPKRLKDVDALLERFKGREHVILQSLRKKYAEGDAASTAPSTRINPSANPSLLFTDVSSLIADHDDTVTDVGLRDASVSTAASWFPPLKMPLTQHVLTLKPVTTSVQPSINNNNFFSSTVLSSQQSSTLEERHSAKVSLFLNGLVTHASTTQPPLQLSSQSVSATPTATASPKIGSTSRSSLPHDERTSNSGHTSAARQAEMRNLIRQMTSLDVGELAARVEELMRKSQSSSISSSATPTEESRVPRLHWRDKADYNSSAFLTAPRLPSPSSSAGGGADAPGNVGAVLHHTAVFVTFFANCARRFVGLAEEEQRHWATQQWRQEAERVQTPELSADAKAVSQSDVPAKSNSNCGGEGELRHHHDSGRNNEEETAGYNHRQSIDLSPDAVAPCISSLLPPQPLPSTPSPKKDTIPSATAVRLNGGPNDNPLSTSSRDQRSRRSTSTCVRSIRHKRSSSAHNTHSPFSTEDARSPPACRTTTVTPLTSSDGSTPERQLPLSDHVNSPLPPSPPGQTPKGNQLHYDQPFHTADNINNNHNMNNDNDSCEDRFSASTTPPPPPPLFPPPSTQSLAGQLTLTTNTTIDHAKAKRLLHWSPSPGQTNRYGPLCHTVESGDCIVLQPGVYYENFHFDHCGCVELTSAYPGAAVVLRPFSDLEPVLTVSGSGTHVTLTGVVLVQGEMGAADNNSKEIENEQAQQAISLKSQVGDTSNDDERGNERKGMLVASRLGKPAVPLLSVCDGAVVTATASHFYGGGGGGIVAAGRHTHLRLDLCLISLCGFAGVYLHGGASADITQSKLKKSEVGLRVLQGSFFVSETTFESNVSDGLVVYEESLGVLERSNVFNNGGNGVFLSSGTDLRVVASTIELNALYGVQRTRGSTLHVKSSFIRDNGLLPINEDVE